MKSLGLLTLCTFLLLAEGKQYHPIPTFFHQRDSHGKPLDANRTDFHLKGPFVNQIDIKNNLEASLKVWPEEVENAGQVTILWEGIPNPTSGDRIGYYCPYYDNPAHGLDYIDVTKSPTWQEGYGYYTVKLYNMRSPCAFRYYSGGKTLVAISNKVRFTNGDAFAPLQVHLAMTIKPTEMRVMWVAAKVDSGIKVSYGKTKALGTTQTKFTANTYKASDMCEANANTTGFWDPGYIYDVLLTDLEPNTRYYYSCGTEEFMSPVANFTTPMAAGDKTPFNYIVYGDMGLEPFPEGIETAKLVRQEIDDNDVRFVYHHGDISYARGYAYIWDQWFDLIQPYASLIPYMVGVGNHEQDHMNGHEHDPSNQPNFHPTWFNGYTDSGGECGVPTVHRFHMPDNGLKLYWYSYDYGMVHMVMLSTEHDYRPGSPQYVWLENDLKSVDRTKTPFVLVGGHRPMYCSESVYPDYVVALRMQQYFEDLLYKYKVDVGLWAHYHSYERTCKVYRNECRDDGILHLVIGSGGQTLDVDKWYPKEWSVFHKDDYGYGRFSVKNSTHIFFEFVQNRSQKVIDSVWISK
ncbi:uncharacterized protein [Clytia hemisphaerica]|uniref:uncharacterized protein n=1 Tax=Clytia hemisphaerica TaxID=252671 RepID=UPI0034D4FA31